MLEILRNFNAERMDTEELVELSAYARSLQQEYQTLGIDQPKWMEPRIRELLRAIRTRNEDQLEARIREATSRLQALKPAEEKRTELAAQVEQLKNQLKTIREG